MIPMPMRSPLRLLGALAGLLAAGVGASPGQAQGSGFVFLPPPVEPQALCVAEPAAAAAAVTDPSQGPEALEAESPFLPYIRRDIRDLQSRDAARWHDFLLDLIRWQAELDPDFAGAGQALATAALQVDAGRDEELRDSGVLDRLRAGEWPLGDGQRVALARFFLNGLGTPPDVPFGQSLLREAAYGGHPDALLAIARMEAEGRPMPQWEAPLDLTLTLAFGGLLGAMDPGICRRAERIAGLFRAGEVVPRNPSAALAWDRFAADLGSPHAAWRVVQAAVAGEAAAGDSTELARYVAVASSGGFEPRPADLEALALRGPAENAGGDAAADLPRPSVASLLDLSADPDAVEAVEDGPYLRYLREVARFDTAPGWVFKRLADETMVRLGRWAGEPEAMALLEEAARRGDPEGMRDLARMLLRHRGDPGRLARAIDLLTEAAERFGDAAALHELDTLFRCQAPDAPRLAEAEHWAGAWRAADVMPADISFEDAVTLRAAEDPWLVARLQTQALAEDPSALARLVQRLEGDPAVPGSALALWAARAQESDKALELFAVSEAGLARSPAERDGAMALFDRVHRHNGVTSALDLAVALVDDGGRDPAVADQVRELLLRAGNRGEGAAIRLLSRLDAGRRPPVEVYDQFAQVIEERGDFLALMFAIPFVPYERAQDYVERAVSLMACTSKDVEELGDAAALLQDAEGTYRWRLVGLSIEGGHTLSRLDLQNRQVASFGQGGVPDPAEVLARQAAEGDRGAWQGLWQLTSTPGLPTYDPEAAAAHLLDALRSEGGEAWVLRSYRAAAAEVRDAVSARFDMRNLLERAAARGDAEAALDLGLLLRDEATGPADVSAALRWLEAAAQAGNPKAMSELGRLLAAGLGGAAEREAALRWLERAAAAGDAEAGTLARLLGLGATP